MIFWHTEKKEKTKMNDISVGQFLEFELYFEMAQHLKCDMDTLHKMKHYDPATYKKAAQHVLPVVSEECRMHILQKALKVKEQASAKVCSS